MDMFDRMEALVKEKGWTRSEFLRRIGLNSSAMRDWRENKASPDKHMDKIVRVLETTETYLRGETTDPRSENAKDLDEFEWEMINSTKGLSDAQKRAIIQTIKAMKE